MKYKYSDEKLKQVVQESSSMRQVCEILKINYSGGNFSHLKQRIEKAGIDRSHFAGQGWRKDRVFPSKRDINDYLNNIKNISSHTLKLRLLKDNIFKHECMKCSLVLWLNEPIPLELHHIDGNRENNKLTNLQLLCPNCHAKTDNYCYRNNTLLKNKSIKEKIIKERITTPKPTKILWPSKDELEILIWSKPTNQVAKELGVSDSAIGKRCKMLEINKPPRGYWEKLYHKNI